MLTKWPSSMKLIVMPGRLRQEVGRFEASLRYDVGLRDTVCQESWPMKMEDKLR